jgi:hypothetical protein
MSIEETRQLGIEFERRVQTMIPETEFARKLDTETIYSFLNQYQDKYVHDIYRNLDSIQSGTKLSAHVERVLQQMLKSADIVAEDKIDDHTGYIEDPNGIQIIDTARSITYELPTDFYMYVRSVSRVDSTFSFKGGSESASKSIRILPNQLMSQNDIWKLVETPHDSLRILRYPAAVLSEYTKSEKPTITVIYDRYTHANGIKVLYYKQPAHFDLMTSTACELPSDAFDDLVSGAVELYVQYVAGAESKRRQQQEAAQKRARED